MQQIIFIIGGQRSGKSCYAQKLAMAKVDNPVYLATVWDDDFQQRIERHQADRSDKWETEDLELQLHGRTVV